VGAKRERERERERKREREVTEAKGEELLDMRERD
jgi:hypothetical protein